MENIEKVGIDKLERLTVAVAKAGTELGEVMEDGKVDFMEGFGLTDNILEVVMAAKNPQALRDELEDFSDEEKEQLISTFKQDFDLPQDDAEQFTEDTVELLLHIVAYVNKARQLSQKNN